MSSAEEVFLLATLDMPLSSVRDVVVVMVSWETKDAAAELSVLLRMIKKVKVILTHCTWRRKGILHTPWLVHFRLDTGRRANRPLLLVLLYA